MGRDTLKRYWIEYVGGPIEVKEFSSAQKAAEYVHNEGDHVWDYGPVIEKDRNEILFNK